jgi:hypothetical protein
MKKTSLFSIVALLASNVFVFGQSNTVSSGGNASSSSGSVSYSIGQVVYTSAEGDNGSINQGVQQPYSVDVVTGIEHPEIDLSVFPNPTQGQISLNIALDRTELFSCSLFDAAGRLVFAQDKLYPSTTISLETFAVGTYTLSVSKEKEVVKSFRVVRAY